MRIVEHRAVNYQLSLGYHKRLYTNNPKLETRTILGRGLTRAGLGKCGFLGGFCTSIAYRGGPEKGRKKVKLRF